LLLPIAFLTAEKRLKIIYLAFFSLFVAASLFIFQPHHYDNIKILSYWFLLSAVISAALLVNLWRKNVLIKIFVILIFPLFVLSSVLDIVHLYLHPGYSLLNEESIQAANFVKNSTPYNAIFLTSDQHNHFIPTLTGR